MDCSPLGSSVHGDSPGRNTRIGCHALLQGIFPTLRSNPGLLHCWQILYSLSNQGSLLTNILLTKVLTYSICISHTQKHTCTYRDTHKKLCNSAGAQCEVGEETKQNWICCQKTLVSNYSSARNSLSDVEQNHLSGLSLLNCVKV